MKDPQNYLDISSAYIKTKKVKVKRARAVRQLQAEGKPVVESSGVYGSSHVRIAKSDE